MQRLLCEQFHRIDADADGLVSEDDVKLALDKILRKQVQRIQHSALDDCFDYETIREQMFSNGSYAKDTVALVLESFRGTEVLGDEETFIQLSDLLQIFYDDEGMNRKATMVRGNDFCEMLALFYDLADRIRSYLTQQVETRDSKIREQTEQIKQLEQQLASPDCSLSSTSVSKVSKHAVKKKKKKPRSTPTATIQLDDNSAQQTTWLCEQNALL